MTGAGFGGVDIDLLADYIGGALDGTPDKSAVATLIAEDPQWRAAYESLGGGMALVQAELSRMPAEPMPVDLAERLDELFASPAAGPSAKPAGIREPATNPDQAGHPDRAPATPHLAVVRDIGAPGDRPPGVPAKGRAPARTRRRPKWAAPVAVAAGLVFLAGFSIDYLNGRNSDSAADSGVAAESRAGAGAPMAAPPIFHTGTDYALPDLAAAPAHALAEPQAEPQKDADGPTGSMKSAPSARTLTDPPELARLVALDALQACLDAIEQENAGGVISVESVDYARFKGEPAVVVRFSAANGMWAWASGASCGTPDGHAATLGKVPVR